MVQSKFTTCKELLRMMVTTLISMAEIKTLITANSVASGSLSPLHDASTGCGWRNGLQYGGYIRIYWALGNVPNPTRLGGDTRWLSEGWLITSPAIVWAVGIQGQVVSKEPAFHWGGLISTLGQCIWSIWSVSGKAACTSVTPSYQPTNAA